MVSEHPANGQPIAAQEKTIAQKLRSLEPRTIFLSLSLILCLVTFCWYEHHRISKNEQLEPTLPIMRSDKNIETVMQLQNRPENDHRQYLYSKFTNGLEVVNVEDKTAKSNSFAVAVEAGQFLDPPRVLGLAHFCEHMLFLGTKKYPAPSGFDKYLNLHGGANNAYTAEEATVYYAQLEHSGWKEGMDRLADFFRAPLFDRKFVKKEVHAIESEHAKNKRNPAARMIQIMSSLADPRSPVSRFHTGDIGTLIDQPQKDGIDTVAELKKYFEHNYCPPRMKLVTFGKDSLNAQLREASKHFADIPKGDTCSSVPPQFNTPDPWHPADGPSRMGHWVDTRSTRPQAELWVMWALPSQQKYYKQHPVSYLSHVMNYGGDGSFARTLKDTLGLVTDMDFSGDSNSANTMVFFTATLTHKGRKHPTLVLSCLYAFLATVRNHGIDMKLFKSLSEIEKLMWNWNEEPDPTSTVQTLVEEMTRLPKEDLLTGDYLTPNPDEALTRAVLYALTPDNMNVGFVDPKWNKKDHGDKVKILPHYDAAYQVRSLSEVLPDHVKAWSNWIQDNHKPEMIFDELSTLLTHVDLSPVKMMRHAGPIEDIPKDITLDHAQALLGDDMDAKLYGVRPEEFRSTKESTGSFWFRQGSTFKDPKVDMKFLLRTARETGDGPSPKDDLLVGLYGRLLGEQLGPKTVDLSMTGVSFSVSPSIG
jgi:secreted Zn-dependent insulinase-like peptidase